MERTWSHLVSTFTTDEAGRIFDELDFQRRGEVDVYDLISQVYSFTGKRYEMKDVINLFKRLTGGEDVSKEGFISLFESNA